MTELICLRHAQAECNLHHTMAPSLDSPLTSLGRDQAAAASEQVRRRGAVRVYCSGAARAIETATIVAAGLEVTSLAGLNEVQIGPAADPLDPWTRTASAEALRSWVVDRDLGPAFVDGETGTDVVRRTTEALRAIVGDHPDETVIVVGHVASLTAALSVLCGLHAELWGRPLPHAVPFTVEGGEFWTCKDWPGEIVGGGS
jgi:alpha-ribazole phosphatase/probable phosphoglycerate mutase